MTFDEWFEEYQPIKNNDGDSGLIIFAIKGLSLSDRFGSVGVILRQKNPNGGSWPEADFVTRAWCKPTNYSDS